MIAQNETMCYHIVEGSTSKDLMEEYANLARENIKSEFKLKNGVRKENLHTKFAHAVLKGSKKIPEDWITELEMNVSFDDEIFLLHNLANPPK